jgi:hypothetical protein
MIQLSRRLAPTPETPNSQENNRGLATIKNKTKKTNRLTTIGFLIRYSFTLIQNHH